MKRVLIILLIAGLAAVAWQAFRISGNAGIYVFEGVSGPEGTSEIADPAPVRMEDYADGGPNRLAVLVTDPESDWIGLVRGFKAHGIPFVLTRDPAQALRHQVVLAYPSISGKLLDAPAIRGLAGHVRGGGTLLTFDLAGGGLEEVFGVSGQVPARGRSSIRWLRAGGAPQDAVTGFSSATAEAQVGTYGITPTTAETIAAFDDGSAAATCRRAGGRACLLGIDLGSLAQRAMNGRTETVSPEFVNSYNPSLDLLFHFVRDLYVEGEDEPFLIGTAPAGSAGSVILTHDVDYTRSVNNAVAYADAIRARGVSATFFVQTKYVRDYNDDIFFNDANLAALKALAKDMEIGSHSVAHARDFAAFEPGSGDETYPDYRPFVENRDHTRDATVLGELRVSKFLIEGLLNVPARAFRPGYLADPQHLPQALAATGYRYASTMTANEALTHLPFQATFDRAGRSLLPVWEFPVTIEDEKAPRLGDRLDSALGVIDRIAASKGVAVILIHPDVTDHKLRFEEQLIDRLKGRFWIASLGAFRDWWSARDEARFDYEGGVLSVEAPTRLDRVSIVFPKRGGRATEVSGVTGRRHIRVN